MHHFDGGPWPRTIPTRPAIACSTLLRPVSNDPGSPRRPWRTSPSRPVSRGQRCTGTSQGEMPSCQESSCAQRSDTSSGFVGESRLNRISAARSWSSSRSRFARHTATKRLRCCSRATTASTASGSSKAPRSRFSRWWPSFSARCSSPIRTSTGQGYRSMTRQNGSFVPSSAC